MSVSRTEVIDNLFTTTWRNVKKEVIDQVFEITPLFNRLLENGKVKTTEAGGRFIDIPIRVDKADQNIKFFGKGDTFGTGEKEFLTQLSYEWRYLGDSLIRYWQDDQINRGPAKLLDYVTQKIDNHKSSLVDKLESAAFTADASGIGINSLASLISEDPTTGIVGSLNRATYPVLRNKTSNFSGKTIATDLIPAMRTMVNDLSKYKAGTQRMPDMIITTQAIYEELEDILEGMQQIHTSKTIQASLGFGDIAYKNIPIYWCPQCPAGLMYMINTEHLAFNIDNYAYFDMGAWKEFSNSRDRVTQILTTCQMTCDNFQKQGVIHTIA